MIATSDCVAGWTVFLECRIWRAVGTFCRFLARLLAPREIRVPEEEREEAIEILASYTFEPEEPGEPVKLDESQAPVKPGELEEPAKPEEPEGESAST